MKTQRVTGRIAAALLTLALAGCSEIAIRSAPAKTARPADSGLARMATAAFWDAFYEARYDDIPRVRRLLTAAYLETPTDSQLALLLAHTHLWKIAERARLTTLEPEITDDMIVAARYFEEAQRLAPADRRIAGWLGGTTLALGNIHKDERLTRRGYFMLKDAAAAYPEFNGFSFAYPLMNRPHDSPQFGEGMAAMWRNLEVCTGQRYDRMSPRFTWAEAAARRTTTGPDYVCWNTGRAPHNVEGFFLHFGDALLKNGQPEAARAAYLLIKEVPEYPAWRYGAALEERLANLEGWGRRMRDGDPKNDPPYMFNSALACTGCHAR